MNINNMRNEKVSFFTKVLRSIEVAGNKLPHPLMLFIWGSGIIIVLSAILGAFGVSVQDPRPNSIGEVIAIKSLLSGEGIRFMLTKMVVNYTSFAPLGSVLVALLGLGIASYSGLIKYTLQIMVISVKSKDMIILVTVFAGVCSNLAGELGYVMLIPLSAMVFYSFKLHPLAGVAAAFAGVSGGYSANLLLGTVDPILSGISQEAAHLIDTSYMVGPEANLYFMIVSTFMISFLGYLITKKVVIPFLGDFKPAKDFDDSALQFQVPNEKEKRAFRYTGLSVLVFIVLLVISVYPGKGILLNQATLSIAGSPFLNSIVPFIFFFFLITGCVFGFVSGNFKSYRDVIDAMNRAFKEMALYFVIVFFIAQFIAYIKYTDIGLILAISGAAFLGDLGIPMSLLLIMTIVISGGLNLLMGSASAKWAVLAPVFIPLFMLLGVAPEVVQVSYRIGDSITNIISPINSFIALILVECSRYSKTFGIGSLISMMIPYSIVFLIGWSLLFYVYIFVFGLPVGPGMDHPYLYGAN